MKLINVHTYNISEHLDRKIPQYAILSHTWGTDELTLQEWETKRPDPTSQRYGARKIYDACKRAIQDGYDYIWVDTVCINKLSSAELSEAINSMFSWYAKSEVCYAYLRDVPYATELDNELPNSPFRKSKWFTRGWTLQELLAPREVIFFSDDWQRIDSKENLRYLITEITNIDGSSLRNNVSGIPRPFAIHGASKVLAWASRRETTRVEDRAYCLLGLFDIHMPLIYGEGSMAFRRLQEEIVRRYGDQTILAFRPPDLVAENRLGWPMMEALAEGPESFQYSSDIQLREFGFLRDVDASAAQFSVSHIGITFSTPMIRTLSSCFVLAILNCSDDAFARDANYNIAAWENYVCLPLMRRRSTYTRIMYPCPNFPITPLTVSGGSAPSFAAELSKVTIALGDAKMLRFGGTVEQNRALAGDLRELHARRPKLSWLITFPRGAGNYRLFAAYPDVDLFPNASTMMTSPLGLNSSGKVWTGWLQFKERGTRPARFVTVSMAVLDGDPETRTCKVYHSRQVSEYSDEVVMDPVLSPEVAAALGEGYLEEGSKRAHRAGNAMISVQNKTVHHMTLSRENGDDIDSDDEGNERATKDEVMTVIMTEIYFDAEDIVWKRVGWKKTEPELWQSMGEHTDEDD